MLSLVEMNMLIFQNVCSDSPVTCPGREEQTTVHEGTTEFTTLRPRCKVLPWAVVTWCQLVLAVLLFVFLFLVLVLHGLLGLEIPK